MEICSKISNSLSINGFEKKGWLKYRIIPSFSLSLQSNLKDFDNLIIFSIFNSGNFTIFPFVLFFFASNSSGYCNHTSSKNLKEPYL